MGILEVAWVKRKGYIVSGICTLQRRNTGRLVEETRTRDLTVTELYTPGTAFKIFVFFSHCAIIVILFIIKLKEKKGKRRLFFFLCSMKDVK